jgi:uncharacterized protein (DUF4213/DUF364 family)
MILDKTYSLLKTKYKNQTENLKIEDIRIGLFLTAVLLSDGSCGVASSDAGSQHHCDKKNRDFGDFTPLKIKGQTVSRLFDADKKFRLTDTLKLAVFNAISSRLLSASDYKIIENCDPIDLIDLKSRKTITVVGGFQSYIKKISETDNKLYVLELNEDALNADHKKYYVPANEYTKILPLSDIVIITGLTLVNSTIDGLLSAVSPGAQVIVTGPSSSLIPDILFENGVSIIGSTRITNPDLCFQIVGEAGAGYHLFEYCAQKICVLNG